MIDKATIKKVREAYKHALDASRYWHRQRQYRPRGFTKEVYFADGQEWAWHDVANLLGVELYDENLKLIEE